MMKEKTVCFTGHREIPFLKQRQIRHKLKKTLRGLIEQGYCYFGAGGALGFDTLAAQTALDLKGVDETISIPRVFQGMPAAPALLHLLPYAAVWRRVCVAHPSPGVPLKNLRPITEQIFSSARQKTKKYGRISSLISQAKGKSAR